MAYGVGVGGGSVPVPEATRQQGFNVTTMHAYVVPTNSTDPRTPLCGAPLSSIGLFVDNWTFHHYDPGNDHHWGDMGAQVCSDCNSQVNS